MKPNDHLNNLHEKLNSKSVINDFDSLWDELEPRLPQKKKRRYFYLFIPLLLLLGAFLYSLNSTNHTFNSDGISQNETIGSDTKPESTFGLESIAEIKSGENIEEKYEENIEENIEEKNEEIIASSKSYDKEDNTIHSKSTSIKQNLIENDIKIKSTGYEAQVKDEIIISNSEKPSDKLGNQFISNTTLRNSSSDEIISSTDVNTRNIESTVILNDSNINKNIPFISIQSIDNKLIPLLDVQDAALLINPKYSKPKDSSTSSWTFTASTHALVDFNQKSIDVFSDYGQTLDDLTSIRSGYSYGTTLSIIHPSGIFSGIGLERSESFEKFRLNNIITSTETGINEQAFLFNGNFIPNEEEKMKTTKQDVLVYNSYFQTNISPVIGYQRSGLINYSFFASPIINVNRTYNGYLISESEELTTDIEQLYQSSKLAYNGFIFGAIASKRVWRKFDIGLRAQYRNTSNLTADSNVDFKVGLKSFSFGLDFRVSLN